VSWGFFLDARLTVPARAWKTLQRERPERFPTPVGWWGLKDRELERRFIDSCGDVSRHLTFGKLVDRFARMQGSKGEVTTRGATTTVRVLTVLDRSGDTDLARGIAALFAAAAPLGGQGAVSLINDGTYVGEDGATVTLKAGAWSRERIDDCWELTEPLAAELFGEEEVEEAPDSSAHQVPPRHISYERPRRGRPASPVTPPNAEAFVALSAQLANSGEKKKLFDAFLAYLDAGGAPTPGAVCNGLHPILGGLKPPTDFARRRFPKLVEAALADPQFRAHDVAMVQLGVALDRMPQHRALFVRRGLPHRGEAAAGLHAQLTWHSFAAKDTRAQAQMLETVDAALAKTPRYLDAQTYTFDNLAAIALRRGERERAIGYLKRLARADPERFPATKGDADWKKLRGDPAFEALYARVRVGGKRARR